MASSALAKFRANGLPTWAHAGLAVLAFATILAGVTASIQMFGDPKAAGPRVVIPLTPSGSDAPVVSVTEGAIDPALVQDDLNDPGGLADPGAALADVPALANAPSPEGGIDPGVEVVRPRANPLPRAPLAGLHEPGPLGPLPIVAADGRSVAKAYARPFTGDSKKAKIAIVIGGLGVNSAVTQAAIDTLPPDVTLSFVPYAANLQSWIDKARADGHEVMLELPMEPLDSRTDDTGPDTLTANAAARDNLQRLERSLSRAAGYFAVTNYQGARFVNSTVAAAPITQALQKRGLVFMGNAVGARTGFGVEAKRANLPFASVDRIVDSRRSADAIDEQLLHLEALALQNGSALGSGFAFPVTIDQIHKWTENLSVRGYQLAPASAVMAGRAASAR
jgi:hypothetical protein